MTPEDVAGSFTPPRTITRPDAEHVPEPELRTFTIYKRAERNSIPCLVVVGMVDAGEHEAALISGAETFRQDGPLVAIAQEDEHERTMRLRHIASFVPEHE